MATVQRWGDEREEGKTSQNTFILISCKFCKHPLVRVYRNCIANIGLLVYPKCFL